MKHARNKIKHRVIDARKTERTAVRRVERDRLIADLGGWIRQRLEDERDRERDATPGRFEGRKPVSQESQERISRKANERNWIPADSIREERISRDMLTREDTPAPISAWAFLPKTGKPVEELSADDLGIRTLNAIQGHATWRSDDRGGGKEAQGNRNCKLVRQFREHAGAVIANVAIGKCWSRHKPALKKIKVPSYVAPEHALEWIKHVRVKPSITFRQDLNDVVSDLLEREEKRKKS